MEQQALALQLLQLGNLAYQEWASSGFEDGSRDTELFQPVAHAWERALTIYQGLRDRPKEETLLFSLGRVYRENGDSARAIPYFQSLLIRYQQVRKRELSGRVFAMLGDAYNPIRGVF